MPDKPAHMIEISDALARDVDRFHAGDGPAPPIEAFMSEDSLEQVARQTAGTGTVRQEDMVPITPAEAARRTTFDGEHLPRVPRMSRVLPAPFRRERVDLTRHGRAWTECRADEVAKDDVVPDVGRIAAVEPVLRYETVAGIPDVAVGMKVILVGVAGNRVAFNPGDSLRAFRLAE
jgi:hypothetical protein